MPGNKAARFESTFPDSFFLFRGIAPAERQAYLAQAEPPEHFSRGAVIYTSQHFRRAIGAVITGTVRAHHASTVLNRLERGDVFGVAALYGDDTAYVTEIRAATACTVQFFSQELVESWMREDFRLAENYMRFLSDRIRFLNRRIAAFTGGEAEKRLLTFLRQHADPNGQVSLPFSMTELSRLLDIGRSSLYRSLDLLEQSGDIRREGKCILLLSTK